MNKRERIDFVKSGLIGYSRLNARSKERTSEAAWIALKLGCTEAQAVKHIAEARADADKAMKKAEVNAKVAAKPLSERELSLCLQALGLWLSDYPIDKELEVELGTLRDKLRMMGVDDGAADE